MYDFFAQIDPIYEYEQNNKQKIEVSAWRMTQNNGFLLGAFFTSWKCYLLKIGKSKITMNDKRSHFKPTNH